MLKLNFAPYVFASGFDYWFDFSYSYFIKLCVPERVSKFSTVESKVDFRKIFNRRKYNNVERPKFLTNALP